jgi:protein TonB
MQTSLTPTPPVKQTLTPPAPAKPILLDAQASQALKSRNMMKMRIPIQTQQSTPSLPTKKTRTNSQNRVVPPLPTMRKERFAARSLPTPPTLGTPRKLVATPPAQTGSTVTRPTIITSSRPAYPRVARESGWEGTVIIRTLIDTNGRPSQVKIRKSCGHPMLDQAAQDAIQHWKFQPAKDGNIPITKWVDIPIKFDLNS